MRLRWFGFAWLSWAGFRSHCGLVFNACVVGGLCSVFHFCFASLVLLRGHAALVAVPKKKKEKKKTPLVRMFCLVFHSLCLQTTTVQLLAFL